MRMVRNASTTCTGGTLTATAGSGVIAYTGGSVPGLDAYVVLDDLGNGMRMTSEAGKPVINSFSTSSNPIFLGDSVTLTWDVADADSVTAVLDAMNRQTERYDTVHTTQNTQESEVKELRQRLENLEKIVYKQAG